jgi:hypothetical protein
VPAPYPDQQRKARGEIDALFSNTASVRVIHYSCESFDDRADGKSPRITSIAIRRLDSGQTQSFSIHAIAERRHVDLADIEAHYDALEKIMLDEFFEHVRSSGEVEYLHWNMRDSNYGFAAIEHRYKVLGGSPEHISEHRRHDLSIILQDIYGSEYIPHRRLENLTKENGITMLRFLSGATEADKFLQKDYVALHQSTLRKVDVLSVIVERARRRTLKTRASWWVQNGGTVRAFWFWIVANQSLLFLIAALGLIVTIVQIILHR